MFDLCRVSSSGRRLWLRAGGAATPDATRPRFGSSETADAKSAQAAAVDDHAEAERRLAAHIRVKILAHFGANVLCPKIRVADVINIYLWMSFRAKLAPQRRASAP